MDETLAKETDDVRTLQEIERIEELFIRFHVFGDSQRWAELGRLLSEGCSCDRIHPSPG